MNNLPPEILQNIFLLLHQRDKVECMTVCRHWKQSMEDSVLFDTLCLYEERQLRDFMLKYQRDPRRCEKIGRLFINIKWLQGPDLYSLLSIITNLRELHLYQVFHRDWMPSTQLVSSRPWYKTIKTIDDITMSRMAHEILEVGLFPVLTELSLHRIFRIKKTEFIALLRNTPALKSLCIKRFYQTSLADLESIHTNAPLLSSFTIECSSIDSAVTPLSEIQPAASITKLTMASIHVSSPLAYNNLQIYFSMKYPKVTEMIHDIAVIGSDNRRIYNDRTGDVYFIIKIAPHLTSLKLGRREHARHIISILDSKNSRIKEFEFYLSITHSDLYRLVKSNQARYIQSLSLKGIFMGRFIKYLGIFPSLTELSLCCIPDSLPQTDAATNINRLLEKIGDNLKILRLSQSTLEFDLPFTQAYSGLKKLTIEASTIPKNGDYYMSKLFPKLRTLILNTNTWGESLISFEGINLDYLEFIHKFKSTEPCVLLKTTSNNEERLYTTKRTLEGTGYFMFDPIFSPAVKSFPRGKVDCSPSITFTCSSVRAFFLADCSKNIIMD